MTFGALAQIPDPGSGQKVNYFKRNLKENINFWSSGSDPRSRTWPKSNDFNWFVIDFNWFLIDFNWFVIEILTFGTLAQIPDPGSGQKVNYFKRVLKENIDFGSSGCHPRPIG